MYVKLCVVCNACKALFIYIILYIQREFTRLYKEALETLQQVMEEKRVEQMARLEAA